MHKDHRNVCPMCGSEKLKKLYSNRCYHCENNHRIFTGDVIPKWRFEKERKKIGFIEMNFKYLNYLKEKCNGWKTSVWRKYKYNIRKSLIKKIENLPTSRHR